MGRGHFPLIFQEKKFIIEKYKKVTFFGLPLIFRQRIVIIKNVIRLNFLAFWASIFWKRIKKYVKHEGFREIFGRWLKKVIRIFRFFLPEKSWNNIPDYIYEKCQKTALCNAIHLTGIVTTRNTTVKPNTPIMQQEVFTPAFSIHMEL